MIPVTLVNKTGAGAIRAALVAGTPVTAIFGFNYRAGSPQSAKIIGLASTDKVASSTSRGTTPADGFLKPDVGPPGLHTSSANSGTGNVGLDESGTSLATPHTAGNAALVKSAHPASPAEEIKAALVDTASGVLTIDGQGKGIEYGSAGSTLVASTASRRSAARCSPSSRTAPARWGWASVRWRRPGG